MIKNKIIYITIFWIICSISNTSFAAKSINKIAAIVGSDIITTKELSEKTKAVIEHLSRQNIPLPPKDALEHQVLNKMILDQIQLQMAKQVAIEVDSTSVNQTIEELAKQQRLTLSEYKKKVQQNGTSFQEFREHIKTELILSRLQQREIGNEIRISNAEIDGYLNSKEGQDNSGVEYHLGHILIVSSLKQAENKALSILKELKQGKDFKQAAASYSADMKALDGGDLGWRKLKEIPTIFVNQVPNMQINEIIGPIQSASGFHIIKLYNKRFGKKEDYTELKARQILIKTGSSASDEEAKKMLLQIRQQIIKGQAFEKLAEQYSQELHTAAKGGDLGWITETDVFADFWNNIIKLSINDISEPFKTELGWHLVQLTNKRSANVSKDAMRRQAADILRERKFNEMLEIWLKKIRDEAKVDVLL